MQTTVTCLQNFTLGTWEGSEHHWYVKNEYLTEKLLTTAFRAIINTETIVL